MKSLLILALTAALASAQSTGDYLLQRKTSTGYAAKSVTPENGKMLGWNSSGDPVTIAPVTSLSWDAISSKPSTFAPSSHTHTADAVTDPENIVTTARVNTAIETDPASSLASLGIPATQIRLPRLSERFLSWAGAGTGSASYPWIAPIRVLSMGDSLAEQSPNFGLDHALGIAGSAYWSPVTYAGSAAQVVGASDINAWTIWPTGRYFNIPAGGSIIFSQDGGSGSNADVIGVGYIKESGAGTLTVQHSRDGGSTWETALAAIDCANATRIGAWSETACSASNLVKIKLSASGAGPVKVISAGGWVRGGGGIVSGGGLFAYSGQSLLGTLETGIYKGFSQCSPSIYVPLLAGYNPDIVIELFNEVLGFPGTWDADGPHDDIVSAVRGGISHNVDWVLVAPNPQYGESDASMVSSGLALLKAAAERTDCNFFDGYSIFGSLADMQSLDLIEDIAQPTHPTATGYYLRNSAFVKSALASTVGTDGVTMPRSKIGGMDITMDTHPDAIGSSAKAWKLGGSATSSNTLRFPGTFFAEGGVYAKATGETDNWTKRAGFYMVGGSSNDAVMRNIAGGRWIPYANGDIFGTPTARWLHFATQLQASAQIVLPYAATSASSYTITEANHTLNVTGGSCAVTLPDSYALVGSTPTVGGVAGAIYRVKNSGSGTVTITPTGGELIDGAANITLAAGAKATIQSTGTGYITL